MHGILHATFNDDDYCDFLYHESSLLKLEGNVFNLVSISDKIVVSKRLSITFLLLLRIFALLSPDGCWMIQMLDDPHNFSFH